MKHTEYLKSCSTTYRESLFSTHPAGTVACWNVNVDLIFPGNLASCTLFACLIFVVPLQLLWNKRTILYDIWGVVIYICLLQRLEIVLLLEGSLPPPTSILQ